MNGTFHPSPSVGMINLSTGGRGVAFRRLHARASSDRGAAAVEFALVSVLLITLLFGIIQYSFLFWEAQTASRIAREVGRAAAVGTQTCAEMQAGADSQLGTKTVAIDVDFPGSPAVGDTVSATVSFDGTRLGFPFIPVPGGDTISQTADARIENVTANSTDCVAP